MTEQPPTDRAGTERPRTVLHIGSDKAGSTALQMWLAANRPALLDLGVWYPDLDGRPDHRGLADGRPVAAGLDPGGANTVVISSEALWPLPPANIRSIIDRLPSGPVQIVAYVRRPGDFAEAAFLQRCRMSGTEPRLRAMIRLLALPPTINPIAHRTVRRVRQLRRWVEHCRSDARLVLTTRPYAPWSWPNGNIAVDFCDAADLAPLRSLVPAAPTGNNRTVDLHALHASILVAQRLGPDVQTDFLRWCTEGPNTDRFTPAGAYTSDRLRAFVDTRCRPLLERLGTDHGDLSPILTERPRPVIPALFDRASALALVDEYRSERSPGDPLG